MAHPCYCKFLPVLLLQKICLFFEVCTFVCIIHFLCIHPLMDTQVDSIPRLLWIMLSKTERAVISSKYWLYFFRCIFNFSRNFYSAFHNGYSNVFPLKELKGSHFSTYSTTQFFSLFFFLNRDFNGVIVTSQCGFNFWKTAQRIDFKCSAWKKCVDMVCVTADCDSTWDTHVRVPMRVRAAASDSPA